MADDLKRKRAGGRSGHAERAGHRAIDQMPWRIPQNYDRPTEPLGPEGIEAIHKGAMRVLKDIGIRFLNDEALAIFAKAGCKVDGQTVRMDEDFVMEMLARAPAEFTVTPRNPDRAIPFGGKALLFGNVSSPPNYWDLERGKVSGFMEGFRTFIKLTQYFNCIHFAGGYPVEPIEIHPSVRHLDCLYEKLTLTDKVCHAYSLGKERVEDAMEMVRIAGGLSLDEFHAQPRMFTNINSVSPLKHDFPMIDGALRLARAGQVVVVTPFTLAGAMAPVTMAGAVTLSIAEALSAIALLQFVKPGAPCMIGTFTSNVDMKSGAPAFGTPEYARAALAGGQLARRYGIPYRSSNANACTIVDAQAAYESEMSVWSAVMGHANLVMHAAGWMEGGLVASFEKMVVDAEILQMMAEFLKPIEVTEETMGISAMEEVGPGGHYFGAAHTLERYETAFYSPILSDWRNFETWRLDGAKTAFDRANAIYKELLAAYEPPPIDPGIDEALKDYMTRRKAEPIAA